MLRLTIKESGKVKNKVENGMTLIDVMHYQQLLSRLLRFDIPDQTQNLRFLKQLVICYGRE